MKNALKYGFVVILSIGLFFSAIGNETCFNSVDNHFISQILDNDSQGGDAENAHTFHHQSEDLLSPIDCPNYVNGVISIDIVILSPVRISNSFFNSIWQPPKFS